jgi:FeS assembly SUF system regulator
MIRITNFADYAVVVMLHAAQSFGADEREARFNAGQLAESTSVPGPTVAKVMGLLSKAGLLVSHRGVGGGFRLGRPAADITIADIIEAVDGPIALTQCVEPEGQHRDGECNLESLCAMRPHWQVINRTVRQALSTVTLEQLVQQSAPAFGVSLGDFARANA